MDQSVPEATTLWSKLVQPTIGLHFPRFALFILFALPVEIFCDVRSRCFTCSFSTIFLQLLIGVSATVASYYCYTTFYLPGERMHLPSWLFPLIITALLLPFVSFSFGVASQLRRGEFLTCVLRCVIFSLTVFFAITVIMTSSGLNKWLEKLESEKQKAAQSTTSPSDGLCYLIQRQADHTLPSQTPPGFSP